MKRGNIAGRVLSVLCVLTIAASTFALICGIGLTVYIRKNFERTIDVSLFESAAQSGATKLYCFASDDRRSQDIPIELVGERLASKNSIYVDIYSMPKQLIDAFVAIEDKRFWTHDGVDWKRTAGAVLTFVTNNGKSYGGSTITQQLIKNMTGEDQYSTKRKIQEIIFALDLETKLDKDEIMELYLNIINLSHGCYGVEAAANMYFSKDVSELTLIECAAIAAIANNPTYYDPVRNPENNAERRDLILSQMYEQGIISDDEFYATYGTSLELDMSMAQSSDGVNSWYTDMVVEDVIDDLCREYNYTRATASMLVYSGGLRIYTAMDPRVQSVLEEYYTQRENFPADSGDNCFQSAMIVIDPESGDVLGVAGAVGEKSGNRLQSYATTTKRPSGSVIKPISVYAPALEAGIITSASVYDDVPLEFIKSGDKYVLWPQNSPSIYRGLTNITTALRDSVNTVSVRVLEEYGVARSFDFLKEKAGIESLIDTAVLPDGSVVTDRGLAALALGQQNFGVSLREMTASYTILAADGVYSKPRSYYYVTDSSGNVILENQPESVQAISPANAAVMTKMLQNVVSSGTAKSIKLDKLMDVAGKTGTTQNNCDKWFIGYTTTYLCGVWCGYEYPESLDGIGSNVCLDAWDAVMSTLNQGQEGSRFRLPSDVVRVRCCADSGQIPTEVCRCDVRGDRSVWCYFVKGTEPTEQCRCHVSVEYDLLGGGVAVGECPECDLSCVGLIHVERDFPVQVYVGDAQYVWRPLGFFCEPAEGKNKPFFANMIPEGHYCGISRTSKQFNRACCTHMSCVEQNE